MAHGRAAALLGPPLALVADFSHAALRDAAALLLILLYLLHALLPPEAALASLWLGAAALGGAHAVGVLFVLGLCVRALLLWALVACVIFLFAVWGSLQFDWFREENRELAVLCAHCRKRPSVAEARTQASA